MAKQLKKKTNAEQVMPEEVVTEVVKEEVKKKPIKETVKKSVTKVDNSLPKNDPTRETIVKDETEMTGHILNIDIEPTRRVGMSKAMTVNMGNFESAKIGVWIERVIPDTDRDEAATITEISSRLDEYLKVEVVELQK
jgi:hypothetical protein